MISALAAGAKSGNREDHEKLVNHFRPQILRMMFCRTNSIMDAEDLTQEIFMQMSKNIAGLKDPGKFSSWLFSIAVNKVKDFQRKKRLLSFIMLTDSKPEPCEGVSDSQNVLEQVIKKEFWQQFQQLSQKLSKWEKEIFLLRFTDHMDIKQIAEILNKKESTVKTHLYRAIKKFKGSARLRTLLKGGLS